MKLTSRTRSNLPSLRRILGAMCLLWVSLYLLPARAEPPSTGKVKRPTKARKLPDGAGVAYTRFQTAQWLGLSSRLKGDQTILPDSAKLKAMGKKAITTVDAYLADGATGTQSVQPAPARSKQKGAGQDVEIEVKAIDLVRENLATVHPITGTGARRYIVKVKDPGASLRTRLARNWNGESKFEAMVGETVGLLSGKSVQPAAGELVIWGRKGTTALSKLRRASKTTGNAIVDLLRTEEGMMAAAALVATVGLTIRVAATGVPVDLIALLTSADASQLAQFKEPIIAGLATLWQLRTVLKGRSRARTKAMTRTISDVQKQVDSDTAANPTFLETNKAYRRAVRGELEGTQPASADVLLDNLRGAGL